jgi:glycosyltransferase involved in cell wall biosynthesis
LYGELQGVKIGFSARGLSIPSGGVRQFIRSLLPALAAQVEDDELFVFYNRQKFLGLAPNCREVLIEGDNRIWWDFFLLPRLLRRLKLDAMIFPKNVVPFFTGCECFVVVHDLAYFDEQIGAYPFLDTLYMRTLIPQSLRRAAGVFAVSENTKQDIIRHTHCDAAKITVAYEAADEIYRPIRDHSELENMKQKYDLPEKFILYVGSLSPRKNIVRLIEALSTLRARIPHKLVLTASKSWKDSNVYAAIQQLNLRDRIHKLGYVDQEDMPGLYNLADVYVYPSLYEGFGLPVLEAMQCGCPVVASNATSIPEVAGDAAILVDPYDGKALAEAIYESLTNHGLRKKLVASGYRQAAKFSWDSTVEIMLKTIRCHQFS